MHFAANFIIYIDYYFPATGIQKIEFLDTSVVKTYCSLLSW
jgi:hypothetical protein